MKYKPGILLEVREVSKVLYYQGYYPTNYPDGPYAGPFTHFKIDDLIFIIGTKRDRWNPNLRFLYECWVNGAIETSIYDDVLERFDLFGVVK